MRQLHGQKFCLAKRKKGQIREVSDVRWGEDREKDVKYDEKGKNFQFSSQNSLPISMSRTLSPKSCFIRVWVCCELKIGCFFIQGLFMLS